MTDTERMTVVTERREGEMTQVGGSCMRTHSGLLASGVNGAHLLTTSIIQRFSPWHCVADVLSAIVVACCLATQGRIAISVTMARITTDLTRLGIRRREVPASGTATPAGRGPGRGARRGTETETGTGSTGERGRRSRIVR